MHIKYVHISTTQTLSLLLVGSDQKKKDAEIVYRNVQFKNRN